MLGYRLSAPLMLLALAAALAAGATALAQETGAQGTRPEGVDLSTPRATMRTFRGAFLRPREEGAPDPLEAAAATLDLGAIPGGYRRSRGVELARQLREVMDRIDYVRLSEVPDRAEGEPWIFYQTPDGVIAIARTEAGEWLFTPETVRSIPALFEKLADEPRVGAAAAEAGVLSLGAWLRDQMPGPLRQRIFLLENWQWAGLAIVLVLGYVVSRIVRTLFCMTVGRLLRRRFAVWTVELEQRSMAPVGLVVMAVVWGAGLSLLSLPLGALSFLGTTCSLLVAVGLIWLVVRLVDLVAAVIAREGGGVDQRLDTLLVPFLRTILQILVVIVGLVVVAENFGIQVTAILAGLGLGGIAVALAAQDTLGNFFGSLAVMVERPFRAGDIVKVGDVEGTVEEVGLRSTRIRTPADSIVTVPNSTLAKASVDNKGARRYQRWQTTLSLTYDTPPEKIEAFCEGVRGLISGREHLRQDVVQVSMYEFGQSSLDVRFAVFFEAPDFATELEARHRLALDIIRLAEDLDVAFAFPTRTVHVRADEPLPLEPRPASEDGVAAGARE